MGKEINARRNSLTKLCFAALFFLDRFEQGLGNLQIGA